MISFNPEEAVPKSPEEIAARNYKLRMIHIVRTAYVAAKQLLATPDKPFVDGPVPAWDGGKRLASGDVTEPIWPAVADFCIKHNVNPWIYFRAQIVNRSLLPPQSLMNELSLARYQSFYIAEINACDVHLQCEITAFNRGLDDVWQLYPDAAREQLWTYTLLNETLPMSPLFRYCLGWQYKLKVVTDRYYELAVSQFLSLQVGYVRHWYRLLPSEFVTRANVQRDLAGVVDV